MKEIRLVLKIGLVVLVVLSTSMIAACERGKQITYKANDLEMFANADADAQAKLGEQYLIGKDVRQNIEMALYWFKKSAEAGSAEGQYQLGKYYVLQGKSGDNYREAAIWLKKSSDQGCLKSNLYLGLLYMAGNGVTKNQEKGFQLILSSAEAGYSPGQLMAGSLLITGEGTPKDEQAGFNWVKMAADSGDSTAAIVLASLYLEGTGTKKDLEKSRVLLETAFMERGEYAPTAAYHLGWMYMENNAFPLDSIKAFRWMVLAAKSNIEDSEQRVQTLADKLPRSVLITKCALNITPYYSDKGKDEVLNVTESEVVVILSSDENRVEVFVPDRKLLGYVSKKCVAR